jgi:hypothetical protein
LKSHLRAAFSFDRFIRAMSLFGTFRTWCDVPVESVMRGKADIQYLTNGLREFKLVISLLVTDPLPASAVPNGGLSVGVEHPLDVSV